MSTPSMCQRDSYTKDRTVAIIVDDITMQQETKMITIYPPIVYILLFNIISS